MTYRAELAGLEQRLASAESERDAWRASGRQEKYLEAYFNVEALEAQMDRLQSTRHPVADDPAKVSIRYNRRSYEYRSYRYDRLAGAVSYAKVDRACKLEEPALVDAAPVEESAAIVC